MPAGSGNKDTRKGKTEKEEEEEERATVNLTTNNHCLYMRIENRARRGRRWGGWMGCSIARRGMGNKHCLK